MTKFHLPDKSPFVSASHPTSCNLSFQLATTSWPMIMDACPILKQTIHTVLPQPHAFPHPSHIHARCLCFRISIHSPNLLHVTKLLGKILTLSLRDSISRCQSSQQATLLTASFLHKHSLSSVSMVPFSPSPPMQLRLLHLLFLSPRCKR